MANGNATSTNSATEMTKKTSSGPATAGPPSTEEVVPRCPLTGDCSCLGKTLVKARAPRSRFLSLPGQGRRSPCRADKGSGQGVHGLDGTALGGIVDDTAIIDVAGQR